MLTWTQERTGWVSNGYRIELLEPRHWVLLRNESRQVEAVPADLVPLAETRTLTECKRKAEILDAADRLRRVRRYLWAELIVALPAFALVSKLGPWGPAVFLVLLAIAAHAIGFLAGTYMARSHVAVRDLSEQRGPIADDRLCLWPTRHLTRFRHGL
jgi:hypothetical protein